MSSNTPNLGLYKFADGETPWNNINTNADLLDTWSTTVVKLSPSVTQTGNVAVSGSGSFGGLITGSAGANILGTTQVATLAASGNASVTGTLGVTGATTLNGGTLNGTFGGVPTYTGQPTFNAGVAIAGGQRLTLGASGQALPTFTTVSAGEKVTLFSAIDASHTNYAIGVASNVFWLGIPTSDTARSWSFRAGTTEVVKIDGTGQTTLSGAQQTIDVASGFAEWRFRSTGTGYGHVYGAFNPGLLTLTANVKRSGSNWTMDDTAANGSLVQLESNQVRMLDATYVGPNATVTEMLKATLSALTIPGQFAGATMALSGSASIGAYVAAAQFGVDASHLNTFPSVNGDVVVLVGATQTLTSKTLTTPTIGDFTNAQHGHQNAAGGGTLDVAAIATGQLPIARGGTASGTALGAFNNLSPLTSRGDLLTRDAANNVRLALSAPGTSIFTVLAVGNSESDPSWKATSSAPTGVAILSADANGNLRLNTRLYLFDGLTGWQSTASLIMTPVPGTVVQSSDFVSGISGWRWSASGGNVEVNNITARGEIHASVFSIGEIHVTAGTEIIARSGGTLFTAVTTI